MMMRFCDYRQAEHTAYGGSALPKKYNIKYLWQSLYVLVELHHQLPVEGDILRKQQLR